MSEKVHSKRWARKLKNYWIRRPLVFVQCVQTWRDCTYPDICTHYARLTIPLWHCQWMTRVTFGPSNDAWKYTLYTGWTRPEYVNMTGGTPRQHNCHNSIRAILAACKEGSQQLKYCMKGSLRHESGGSVNGGQCKFFQQKGEILKAKFPLQISSEKDASPDWWGVLHQSSSWLCRASALQRNRVKKLSQLAQPGSSCGRGQYAQAGKDAVQGLQARQNESRTTAATVCHNECGV